MNADRTLMLVVAVLSAAVASAAETFMVPRTPARPVVDGVVREGEYRSAATFRGAANYRHRASDSTPPAIDPREAECALTWDEDFVYFAARSATQPGGVLPKGGPRDPITRTESVEVWFDPPPEIRQAEFSKFGQFQAVVCWDGRIQLMHHNPGFGLPPRKWKVDGLRARNAIVGDAWDVEVAIPAAAFGAEKLGEGEWGLVLGRNYCSHPAVQCTFAPFRTANGAYTDTSCYSRFAFRKGVAPTRFNGEPETILKSIPLPVPCNITARVRTAGKCAPRAYRRFFASQDIKGNGYFGLQETANPDGSVHMLMFFHAIGRKYFKNFIHQRIPEPGEEAVLSMNVLDDRIVEYFDGAKIGEAMTDRPIRTGDFGAAVPSVHPDIETLSFRVTPRALTDDEIKLVAQEGRGLVGDVKWYPSLSSLACELSFPKPDGRDGLPVLKVTDAAGRTVVESRVPSSRTSCVSTGGKSPMLVVHEKVRLAPEGSYLSDGEYKATLSMGGKVEIEKAFLMKRYEWFNTDVATRRDVLLPGFTPVKAGGDAVEVVGRRYVFAGTGLPKEVWSLGKQILAREMRIEGQGIPTGSGRPKVRRVDDTAAEVEGTAAKGLVEQDGFIVCDISVPEGEGDVRLDIPVKAEFANLFHACGEGLRGNPAGFLPKGQGRIFGSRQIVQGHSDNFIPYVWVGTDTRGICYAADSDRGWEHCKERDAVELVREADGTVVIRLNLVNGAGRHPARNVRVTFQASPVKPMPKGWRGWVDAYDVPAERNTVNNASNPTWGDYIGGMSCYPTFMEWEYVHKMIHASKTGEVDKEWVEKWIDRCWKARKEHPELVGWIARKSDEKAAMKSLRDHAYAGLNRLRHLMDKKNRVVYYYTCNADPCGDLYELPVMKDEWGRATSVYGSFQDYAIFYLKRMCEEGMTGVYDDNTFFRANYDWVTGGAWIDAKGNVHPSFQLFSNREYVRRQILAMLEAGVKDPWLTIHHTNANILPVFSFATNTMGMEWKYGSADYQDRWTRDYIRTVNQGYQGGFFATSLEGIFNISEPDEKTRVTRTMLAALLPHEVQPTLQCSGDHKLVLKALRAKQEFGVGADDCEYFAYYDPENPVMQANPDVMVSVYRRGKRLLAVVGSYAEGDVDLVLAPKAGAVEAAEDVLDGEPVACGGGAARLRLKRRDCAMLALRIR